MAGQASELAEVDGGAKPGHGGDEAAIAEIWILGVMEGGLVLSNSTGPITAVQWGRGGVIGVEEGSGGKVPSWGWLTPRLDGLGKSGLGGGSVIPSSRRERCFPQPCPGRTVARPWLGRGSGTKRVLAAKGDNAVLGLTEVVQVAGGALSRATAPSDVTLRRAELRAGVAGGYATDHLSQGVHVGSRWEAGEV